ncbi:hypothetical protein TCAL_14624 [Tigriopus californicus]|uniref:Uncharacterized protein n=1 Tax=Tigriopus californicus TaxID=6832 RepID=A0A553P8A4_TIGCA|nr:hypothetical protein TCAL_14624 [Tigriopus californicus]
MQAGFLFGIDYKPLRNSETKAAKKVGRKFPWYKTISCTIGHAHYGLFIRINSAIWHCGTLQSALHLLQKTHQQLNQQSDDLLEITMELESMFGVIPNQNTSLPDEDIDWDLQEQELNNLLTPENPAPIENWTRLEEEFDHLTKTEKMDSSVQASPTSLTKGTTISHALVQTTSRPNVLVSKPAMYIYVPTRNVATPDLT